MRKPLAALLLVLLTATAQADDLVEIQRMQLGLAQAIAQAAVETCREQGYQVSAVVVDRSAQPQVVLRDVLAPAFTIQIAQEKANAVILSGVASSAFRGNRQDIRMEMNHVDGILVLEGGLPIVAGGGLVGAVGVSGAPGGDKDEACAQAALEQLQERLEFAE